MSLIHCRGAWIGLGRKRASILGQMLVLPPALLHVVWLPKPEPELPS